MNGLDDKVRNTIQNRISESFAQYKDYCAVEYLSRHITYSELYKDMNRITQWLHVNNVEKGTFVGVCFQDRYMVIASMLGIWQAGCVFVPLDADYPDQRLLSMAVASDLKLVITDSMPGLVSLEQAGLKVLTLDRKQLDDLLFSEPMESVEYDEDDAIYIYYTSGTSGTPHAILGRNKGLTHYVEWETSEFELYRKKVSQLTSPSHDPFLRDILVPLLSGGTICIPESRMTLLNTNQLMDWLENRGVQLIHCTPSLFKNMTAFKPNREHYKSLEYIFLAGEEIVPQKLKSWYEAIGDRVQLVNLYGPTETTLAKLFYRIKPQDVYRASMPIGQPISGTRVIILNDDLQMCPVGTKGEIIIRTPYRSLGYLHEEGLNREKFIQNPFSERDNDLVYKTGDIGRALPDGNIEFLGRKDRQVKIRGHRVELAEVERVIMASGLVKDVAVIVKEAPSEELVLIAYVIPNTEIKANYEPVYPYETYIRKVENHLLEPMIPSYFIELSKFPINANGKIEYSALPEPEMVEYVSPVGRFEQEISEIWTEILGVEFIGREHHFLHLGGNSINIMNMIAKVYEKYEVDLTLEVIFENSRLSDIARYVEAEYVERKEAGEEVHGIKNHSGD
ncbi:non-ribosomal peptide synthetase [Paenibacillus marchantiae]|uniref:non-ribosomal peptide synthetase n=1 Tax=Paenibacillus marchantiae TaxID=3026433 RepID=UPI00308435A1